MVFIKDLKFQVTKKGTRITLLYLLTAFLHRTIWIGMQATSLVVTYLYVGKITSILQKNSNTYTALSSKQS